MSETVLITGGAGFIGSHLTDALLADGYHVVVFDNLEPQVHGDSGYWPAYLDPAAERVLGDIRDADALAPMLRRADVVYHLAALVGVGQSMYEIRRYTEVNTAGAAVLLQLLADNRGRCRKLIVASSMSIYGEGAYSCPEHGTVYPRLRPNEQLARHEWEVRCPLCAVPLRPLPTAEDKPLFPTSIYAINKRDHEEMVLAVGQAYDIPSVALRFFNVYGSRQALSNPYTGAAAIFCSRLLNGNRPLVFEDGRQTRDFTHVSDVVQGCRLAMQRPEADGGVFNLGTGRAMSLLELARALSVALGRAVEPQVAEQFRAGDIRHCFADVAHARARLGYAPKVRFEDGVAELIAWVADQPTVEDRADQAVAQLTERGLAR